LLFQAFQCTGKCFFPVSEHLSPTKHAIVQTLLHSVSPGKVSRACCVPTRLEPISVLYVDQKGVLTYRFSYQDMVVAECGCRWSECSLRMYGFTAPKLPQYKRYILK